MSNWTPAAASAALKDGIAKMTRRPRVLVVDDEQAFLDMMGETLEKMGCDVVLCLDGSEGIRHLLDNGFALSFIDLRMPPPDGAEVIQKVLKEKRGAKLILITGGHFNERARMAMDSGAWMFLQKPFTTEKVREIIASLRL